eukprot:9818146-Heterocapsa_arctica.AAC.1
MYIAGTEQPLHMAPLREGRMGRILRQGTNCTGDIRSLVDDPHQTAYCATKTPVHALVQIRCPIRLFWFSRSHHWLAVLQAML